MAKKQVETNPFVLNETGFSIPAVWVSAKMGSTKGEAVVEDSMYGMYRVNPVETAPRVVMYTEGLLNMFLGLSSAGKDMLMYIVVHLQHDQDYLELDEERYMGETGSGRTTFYRARTELTNRVIIPRMSRKGTYWINPMYMFKGRRMAKYPERVKMENAHPFASTPVER